MSDVTLAILAGGEGARMGMPKADLRIAGEPILTYLLRRMAWNGPTMLVTAPGRKRPVGWELFGREVVDPIAGQGPLRGVLTALEHAITPGVVVATVDMPGVGLEQLRWMVTRLEWRSDALGVMMRRDAEIEPFPSAFRIDATELIERELRADRRAMHRLSEHREFLVIDVPPEWDDRVWTNLNRPEDLDEFVRSAQ